jgi:hypothetical protein
MADERNLVVDYHGEHNGEKFNLGIDFKLTDEDLQQPVDDFCERVLKPAFSLLLDQIDRKHGRPTRTERLIAEVKAAFELSKT